MNEQEQLFSELREDLRRDSLKQLWEKYGAALIAACVAIVIGTGIGVAWKGYQASRNSALTGQLIQALALKDDSAKERQALEGVVKAAGSHSQAALARFHLAALDLQSGEGRKTMEDYQALADDTHQDEGLRDLSQVLSANVAAGYALELPPGEGPKPGSAFYNEWREAAAWDAYALGNPDALARFGALKDDADVPAPVRGRMQVVTGFLSPESSAAAQDKVSGESAD